MLMKHHVLLAIQSESKLAKVLLLFGRDGLSGKIVVLSCGKSRESLKF